MNATEYALINGISTVAATVAVIVGLISWEAYKTRKADSRKSAVLDPDTDPAFNDSLDLPGSLPFPGETPLELAIREGSTVTDLIISGFDVTVEPKVELAPVVPFDQKVADDRAAAIARLERVMSAEWIATDYDLRGALKSHQRLDIIEALLKLDGWASKSDVSLVNPNTTFTNHIERLVRLNLVERKGEKRGTKYRVNPDYVGPLSSVIFGDKAVTA